MTGLRDTTLSAAPLAVGAGTGNASRLSPARLAGRLLSAAWLAFAGIASPALAEAPTRPLSAGWSNSCQLSWLATSGLGVSTHYFPRTTGERDELADQLDVDRLAEELHGIGAGWLLFSLHHQSWIMMAPNATYARLLGRSDYSTRRDLPSELSEALARRGIRLLLYVNLRLDGPGTGAAIARQAMGGWPPSDEMIRNVADVYREFSLRYGKAVSGWWVDGAGNPAYVRAPQRERWFGEIAAALRAGNPDAVVSFSPGLGIRRYSLQSDYIAGETNDLAKTPRGRCLEGAQWHTWTYLGGWWGADGVRFRDKELCDYVAKTVVQGGAVTLEVGTLGIARDGLGGKRQKVRPGVAIDDQQLEQLRTLQRARRVDGADGAPRLRYDCSE